MIKTNEIKIISDAGPTSFFLKEGYKSQEQNKTLDSNRDVNYWDINRIINSAWDQADCYRYSKDYVLAADNSVLEIGCGTLVKQNKFFFSNGFNNGYFCIDQQHPFKIAAQLGILNENIHCMSCDLEGSDVDAATNYFKNNNVSFSAILCFDVIEHLYNPSQALNLIKDISNKGTQIIFSTPERDLKRGEECMRSNKPEHVREWNRSEFTTLLEYFGFEIKDVQILNDTDAIENCKSTMLFRCGIK